MDIRADVTLPFPPDTVFAAYRDDLTKLLPYLPNVRSIEVRSRSEVAGRIEMVNEWRGGGEIPAAVRAFVSDSVLAWTDHASWDPKARVCEWRTETHAFTDAVRCGGANAFVEGAPGTTVLQVRGSLEIDAKKIRGVPGFLAGKVGRALEEFLVGKIQSNLVETARGVQRYLEDRPTT